MDDPHPIRNMNVAGYCGKQGFTQVEALRGKPEHGGPIQLFVADGEDNSYVNITVEEALDLIRFLAQAINAVRTREDADV